MTPHERARKAETAARLYLEMRGYTILEQNWRLPRSKIDIIAQKNGVINFIEVIYRAKNETTSVADSLNLSQLKSLRRSANTWVEENKYHGEFVVSTVEVAGADYVVLSFSENVF